jgi:hypothetical protein
MPFVVLWSDTAQGAECGDARACGIFDAIFWRAGDTAGQMLNAISSTIPIPITSTASAMGS